MELLELRERRQQEINDGQMPDFLPETREVRDSDWKVTTIPQDLGDRRVEITGPTDRKMVINALNSGAKVFMADLRRLVNADVAQRHSGADQFARCRHWQH